MCSVTGFVQTFFLVIHVFTHFYLFLAHIELITETFKAKTTFLCFCDGDQYKSPIKLTESTVSLKPV